eukprot:11192807-Lingulodinium_polyedra.AAC.1
MAARRSTAAQRLPVARLRARRLLRSSRPEAPRSPSMYLPSGGSSVPLVVSDLLLPVGVRMQHG